MKSANKKVLITGCAGFIGSHATDYFIEQSYDVIGVDCLTYAGNKNNMANFIDSTPIHYINICETEEVEKIVKDNDIEWIINFAAETHVDNSIDSCTPFINSNITGVKSLLEVCRSTGAKLFHISTDEVYGVANEGTYTEERTLDPKNPYSATKAAAEHFVKSYANTYGVQYLMVRPSNNFGPRQHGEKLLPTVVRNIANGNQVPVYGDGTNIREWTYVKDTGRAIKFILENSPLNETYNISTSYELENLEVINRVCDLMGVEFESSITFVKDRLGHDFRYSISGEKLSELGFNVESNFPSDLKETVEFFSDKYNAV